MVGAIAESAGALGVIATLIYLTLQIRQNSKLIDVNRKAVVAQSAREIELFVANWHLEVARDPSALAIVENMIAYDGGREPSAMEWYAMRNLMLSLLLPMQSQYVNREAGVGHTDSSSRHFRIMRGLIESNAAWRKLWNDEADQMVPGFREAVMALDDVPVFTTSHFTGGNDVAAVEPKCPDR